MMLISCNHSYLWIQTMYSTLMNTKWKCQMPNNLQLWKLHILQSGHNNSCTTFPCCIVKEGNAIQPTYNNKWTIRGFCLFMFGTFLLSNPTVPTHSLMLYEPILQRKLISIETYNHNLSLSSFGRSPLKGPDTSQRAPWEWRQLIYTRCPICMTKSGKRNPTLTFPQ